MRLAASLAPLLLCLAPCVGQKVTPPSGEVPLSSSRPVGKHAVDEGFAGAGWLASDAPVFEPISARFATPLEAHDSSIGRGPVAPPPEGPPPVPEPSTLLLVGTGLIGVALTSRLSKRRSRTD